jgi:hypothetical protein
MRNILIASAFALVGLSAAAPSQAMPFAPADKAPSAFTLTAGGCGPGFHRGPYGGCRPNGGAVVVGPGYHPYAHPYAYGRRCWWRGGVRVCN